MAGEISVNLQEIEIIQSSGLFDVNWYFSQLQDGQDLPSNPISHYLLVGSKQGLMPNRLFKPDWYNMQYPDVAASGMDPLLHYIASGWREGRRPSAIFDPLYYSRNTPGYDSYDEPLSHCLTNGNADGFGNDEYQDWILKFDTLNSENYSNISLACSNMKASPLISIIMPVYNTPEIYLRQTIESVLNQIYPSWELCIVDDCSTLHHVKAVLDEYVNMDTRIRVAYHETNGHISKASNTALAMATGDYIALLDHDDMLRPHSLFMFAETIINNPSLMIIYSDEDRIDNHGNRFLPHFKSDWNKSLFLGQNFVCHLAVYKRKLLESINGFRSEFNGSQDYDLMLRAQAQVSDNHIYHIPHILYHWRAIPGSTASNSQEAKPYSRNAAIDAVDSYLKSEGKTADVVSSPHPAFNRPVFSVQSPDPSVLIIVNIQGEIYDVGETLRSILNRTKYSKFHVVAIVRDSSYENDEIITDLVIKFSDQLTIAANLADISHSDYIKTPSFIYICHIAQPFTVERGDWLSELISLGQQSGNAVVGGSIYNGRNALIAGAYTLHPDELGRPLFGEISIGDGQDYGYFGRAVLVQEVSAVSFDCVLINADVLRRLGGWSRLLEADKATAIELCLEVREHGLAVVWTPNTRLRLLASVEREKVFASRPENDRKERIRAKWGMQLERDPFIGPNLDVGANGPELAFPPKLKVFEQYESGSAGATDVVQTEKRHASFREQAAKVAILAHGLFDFSWYVENNRDVAASGMNPLSHYLTHGWREGRKPNPRFDPDWYLSFNSDVMSAGYEPLSHYALHGRSEGRAAFQMDPGHYSVAGLPNAHSSDIIADGHLLGPEWEDSSENQHLSSEPPSDHALVLDPNDTSLDPGSVISGSGLFNASYYLSENPDVHNAGVDPLTHYASHGWREGRAPNEAFDPTWYLAENEDVRNAGIEPLTHYILVGSSQGRCPNKLFDPTAYRIEHPHVAASGIEPLAHFLLTKTSGSGRNSANSAEDVTRFSSYPPLELPDLFKLKGLAPTGRIAVVLHLYHPDMWEEISDSISNIEFAFDLFVTLVRGSSDQRKRDILKRFPGAHVIIFDQNRGRDVAPFFALLETGALFRYDLICKLHSKRSTYVPDGDAWRRELIDGILGTSETVRKIVNAFDDDPDLGIVVADRNIYQGVECWTGNERFLDVLLPRLGMSKDYHDKSFPGGAIFWMRPIILRAIMGAGIKLADFEPEPMPVNGALGHAIERLYGLVCQDAGMNCLEVSQITNAKNQKIVRTGNNNKIHTFALFLPQFHPTVENNKWWGVGFTEWTNVTKAKKIFPEHRQPRLPSELGFYDLRLEDTRIAQADLAQQYGVDGFCYYYYWFNGRRVLERPLNEILESGKPDRPFLICWANEPWTRNWDGLNSEVLLPQTYDDGWERNFVADLAPLLADGRYFKFNGKPMVMIYRVRHIPDLLSSVTRLRNAFASEGFPEVHLVAGLVDFPNDEDLTADPRDLGFDAYYEFPPHRVPAILLKPRPEGIDPECRTVFDYGKTVDAALKKLDDPVLGTRHRGIMAGFDNTARRGANATVFYGANPANFRRWLRKVVNKEKQEEGERVIFINAWNEWAEGTYMEPDRDFGRGWLEAVASAIGLRRRGPVDFGV